MTAIIDAQQIADVVKGVQPGVTDANTVATFFNLCTSVASDLGVQWFIDSGVSNVQAANIVRGSVLSRINRGVEVSAIGAARGYLLPDNPLPRFDQINSQRRLFARITGVSEPEDKSLTTAVIDLVKIADAYDSGRITFDRSQPASQLSSFDVSVDGMASQSGNALADILGYQPDADFVKRKRALDSLGKLDFSKRKPYLLFTADVITGGKRQNGTIVCWIRMRDASGYNVSKRDVFGIIRFPTINLSNESLERTTAELLADHDFQQALGFYDWVHPGDVFAFVDKNTHPDTLYSYAVSGVQRRVPANTSLFDVQMNSLYLTAAQIDQVRTSIQADLGRFVRSTDLDSVSPYPALAQAAYGDPGYGWILAGCNVLASIRRGDTVDQTRSLSYIGSKASEVLALVSSGKISVPSDVNQVHQAIDTAVSSYGVAQTILAVLDGIGMTMFVAGKDDPLGFKPTPESLQQATGGLAKILGAIDPQTASVDPHTLAAALATHASSGSGPRYAAGQIPTATLAVGGNGNTGIVPPTIKVAPTIESILGEDLIDLTSYDGIARLMQLIRTIYDFYPGALT